MRIPHTAVIALLLLPATRARCDAQLSPIPPVVVSLPGSTRGLGMGDAYVALTGDPDLIFYNPAQLTAARGLGASVHRFGDATTLVTISAAAALAPGGIAIGARFLDQALVASVASPGGEESLLDRGGVLATGGVVSIGYGRSVRGVRAGAGAKVIHQAIGNARDVTVAADVGIAAGSSIQVALTAHDLGPGLRFDGERVGLARRITLGAGIPRREVGPLDLAAGGLVSHQRDGALGAAAGTEWGYMPLDGFTFIGRVGVRMLEGQGARPTLGAGFTGERFSIDYAFHPVGGPGSGHRAGVRWR